MATKKRQPLTVEEKEYLILLLVQRVNEKKIRERFKEEFNRDLQPSHIRYYRKAHEEDINVLRNQFLKKIENEFDEADVIYRIRKLSEVAQNLEEKMEECDKLGLDTKEYRQLADSYRKTLQQIESETAKLKDLQKADNGPDLSGMSNEEFEELKARQKGKDKFLSVRRLMG